MKSLTEMCSDVVFSATEEVRRRDAARRLTRDAPTLLEVLAAARGVGRVPLEGFLAHVALQSAQAGLGYNKASHVVHHISSGSNFVWL